MADSILNSSSDNLFQLQSALQKLKKTEIERARAEAQCSKLESIVRKRLTSQSCELLATKSKSDTNTQCKSEMKIRTIYTKTTAKISKVVEGPALKKGDALKKHQKPASTAPATKKSSGNVPKYQAAGGEGVAVAPLTTKSSEDLRSADSPQKLRSEQVQARIHQYHETLNNIAVLNAISVPEKNSFLRHLQKMNSEGWKSQKAINPSITKLERQMNPSQR